MQTKLLLKDVDFDQENQDQVITTENISDVSDISPLEIDFAEGEDFLHTEGKKEEMLEGRTSESVKEDIDSIDNEGEKFLDSSIESSRDNNDSLLVIANDAIGDDNATPVDTNEIDENAPIEVAPTKKTEILSPITASSGFPYGGRIPQKSPERRSYADRPRTTTFALAQSRVKSSDQGRKSTSVSRRTSQYRPSSRSTSLSTQSSKSSSKSIHDQLYNRSIAQQEEGRKRRNQVESSLKKRELNRYGKAFTAGDISYQRQKHHERRESFREEFTKPQQKISLDQAGHLYIRLSTRQGQKKGG